MNFDHKIAIIYGSLNSVPSPEGMAPAKIIFETVNIIKNTFNIKVVSRYNSKLSSIDFDKKTFIHVKINLLDKILLYILKIVYRYNQRKKMFVTGNDKDLVYYISVCRWLIQNKPSIAIIHVSTGLANMVKLFLPKLPIIYYHHGTSLHSKLNNEQWSRLINGNTKAIISVNKIAIDLANKTFIEKIPLEKCHTIYNGITSLRPIESSILLKKSGRELLNLRNSDFVFMYIGRISIEKGIFKLISSFHELIKKHPNESIKLVIIGGAGGVEVNDSKNEYIAKCKKYVNRNNLPITFTGYLTGASLISSIAACDVGVLPTDAKLSLEGLPLSIIEFFSQSKPVIATNVGGIPEIIQDGWNGLLLTKYPFENQLTLKMEQLYVDKNLYTNLSINAYTSYKKNHTAEVMADNFVQVLKKSLNLHN